MTIPCKDIRIVGGVYHMVAGSPGFTARAPGKYAIFIGCTFVGNSEGSIFNGGSES